MTLGFWNHLLAIGHHFYCAEDSITTVLYIFFFSCLFVCVFACLLVFKLLVACSSAVGDSPASANALSTLCGGPVTPPLPSKAKSCQSVHCGEGGENGKIPRAAEQDGCKQETLLFPLARRRQHWESRAPCWSVALPRQNGYSFGIAKPHRGYPVKVAVSGAV